MRGRASITGLATPLFLATLLLLAAVLACGRTSPGPDHSDLAVIQRVEIREGAFVDAIEVGAEVTVAANGSLGGARLRGVLEPAHSRMVLVGEEARVALPPGPTGSIDVELPPGRWILEGPPATRLLEPRLLTTPTGTSTATASGRLVVLVVVDTLRDDFLSMEHTPATLEALSDARRFLDTRANASWTLPSMASLMTSRAVLELTAPDGTLIGIPPQLPTLAEEFRQQGFRTAAFVANGTLREANGFGRGFVRFEGTGAVEDPPTDAGVILRAARAWIEAHNQEDRFAWIHLMEPHEPLRDHSAAGRVAVEARVIAGRERAPTPAEAELFRDLYAGEVRYLDSLLGAFLADLPRDATVVLTSDHGEMLGELTAWGHGLTVYEPVIRVPLVVRAPGLASGAVSTPAELLDVVPTLLARTDAKLVGAKGRDLLAVAAAEPRPRLAASFSAGPLRWSWQHQQLVVVGHFTHQQDLAPASQVVLHELDPLPSGWQVYHSERGLDQQSPAPLAGPLLAAVAEDFAADVGRLTPGIQLLGVGLEAGEVMAVEVSGEARIVQLFAMGETHHERQGTTVELSWQAPQPLVLAVLAGGARVRAPGAGWAIGRDQPPPLMVPGRSLWRNQRDPSVQHPQDEMLARLRALGYLR